MTMRIHSLSTRRAAERGAILLLLAAGLAGPGTAQPAPSSEPLDGTVQAVYDEQGLLRVGTPAPRFALPRGDGTPVRLEELLGHPIVLYFYPMDDTPGCTKEACAFRDDHAVFDSLGIRVVGISTDDPASHLSFAEKYRLPFLLLSDTDGKVSSLYGVAVEHEREGRKRAVARRVTYLLDAKGVVRRVYSRVDPAGHSAEILAALPGFLSPAPEIKPKETDEPPRPAGH
jgi:peroxiredoxin Q/BCP